MITLQVNCQNKSINDLEFSNFVGKPKKITETITSNGNILDKNITFYSDDGFIIKTEHYNLTKSDFPNKRFLNQLTTNDFKDKNKRKLKNVNIVNKKIESEGVFEKISDSLYRRISKSEFTHLEKLFYFNKDNKLIKTEERGLFNGLEIKTNFSYFYLNNHYDYIIFENIIRKVKMKLTFSNSKYDKMNNLVYYELIDANGNLIQKIEREIEY
jgi:hypothetical protein